MRERERERVRESERESESERERVRESERERERERERECKRERERERVQSIQNGLSLFHDFLFTTFVFRKKTNSCSRRVRKSCLQHIRNEFFKTSA